MKIRELTHTFLLIVLTTTAQLNAQNFRKYQIKSGHLEYLLSGLTTGTKSIWFDNYGAKYREEVNSVMAVETLGKSREVITSSLSINDGEYYYNIDLMTMKGTKIANKAYPNMANLTIEVSDKNAEELGTKAINDLGGTIKKGSATYLNRLCDETTLKGVTTYTYKGILIKTIAPLANTSSSVEATLFDENIAIPTSKFNPPAEADIEDLSTTVSDLLEIESPESTNIAYPSKLTFESFKTETKRLQNTLGYGVAMSSASDGNYSSIATKNMKESIAFIASSLLSNSNWRDIFSDSNFTFFTSGNYAMGYAQIADEDEENETIIEASSLLIEVMEKDALIQIVINPSKTKEEMAEIFFKLDFK